MRKTIAGLAILALAIALSACSEGNGNSAGNAANTSNTAPRSNVNAAAPAATNTAPTPAPTANVAVTDDDVPSGNMAGEMKPIGNMSSVGTNTNRTPSR